MEYRQPDDETGDVPLFGTMGSEEEIYHLFHQGGLESLCFFVCLVCVLCSCNPSHLHSLPFHFLYPLLVLSCQAYIYQWHQALLLLFPQSMIHSTIYSMLLPVDPTTCPTILPSQQPLPPALWSGHSSGSGYGHLEAGVICAQNMGISFCRYVINMNSN